MAGQTDQQTDGRRRSVMRPTRTAALRHHLFEEIVDGVVVVCRQPVVGVWRERANEDIVISMVQDACR